MYKKILLTHDGSEVAALAVPHAAMLAKAAGAPIVVAQVVDSVAQFMTRMEPLIEPMMVGAMTVDLAEKSAKGQRGAAQANLDQVAAVLTKEGVSGVSTLIIEGSAGTSIIDAANSEGADVIVMATHGRSGLGRVLLGSVAEHVVRHAAKQAVLLVRAAS